MTKQINRNNNQRGYSIVELLISLSLISIFTAIAAPSMVSTYRSYQMDDIAGQVAGQLKFTRYEAIRRNNPITCLNKTQNGNLTMFTDDNNDGAVQVSEKQIVFNGNSTRVAAATVPSSAALTAVVNAGTLTTMSPTSGTITFDGRGAKSTAGITVYWVGNAAYGWRAVTVMPSGSIQVWSYATGTWTQVS